MKIAHNAPVCLVLTLILMLMSAGVCLGQAGYPNQARSYVEFPDPSPASNGFVLTVPGGGGDDLGTLGLDIKVVLRDSNNDPIVGYPKEKIGLYLNALSSTGFGCMDNAVAGVDMVMIADADTDSYGVTYISGALSGGGLYQPGQGGVAEAFYVVVTVSDPNEDWYMTMYESGSSINNCKEIYFNSPDIDGNGIVNLSDIVLLSQDRTGSYNWRSDFDDDGDVDLTDVQIFTVHMNSSCD